MGNLIERFPLQLAATVFVVYLCAVAIVAYRRKLPMGHSLRAACFLFPPFSLGVFLVVCITWAALTSLRGPLCVSSYAELETGRGSWCMPKDARDICLINPYLNGYRARFAINSEDLIAWHKQMWADSGNADPASANTQLMSTEAPWPFSVQDWERPDELMVLEGPVRNHVISYWVYFSEQDDLAFLIYNNSFP